MNPTFSTSTRNILEAIHITPFESFAAVEVEALQDRGISFCISDLDGVLRSYNGALEPATLQQLDHLADSLPLGVAVVSNNQQRRLKLPCNVAYYPFNATRPWDFKPLPFRIKHILSQHNAAPDQTLALGDGLTDMMAYKLAHIQHLGMVASLGAHPKQEFVHQNVYRKLSPVVDTVMRFALS